jgi:hypothetical protein
MIGMDDGIEIEMDAYGAMLTQGMLDDIWHRASTAKTNVVTITIRRVSKTPLPRLIADYGGLVHLLAAEIHKERVEK